MYEKREKTETGREGKMPILTSRQITAKVENDQTACNTEDKLDAKTWDICVETYEF